MSAALSNTIFAPAAFARRFTPYAQKLALLEDERSANLKRLEEEMRLKEEMEEKFYREKRKVLEEGIREFQVGASEENVV